MADKSKLIDIDGLKVFREKYDDVVDAKIEAAGVGVTEETVAGWGFTKNTGDYTKPASGIPATDLASAVQTSLGKADTALQSYTETDPVFVASAAYGIKSTDISSWNAKSETITKIQSAEPTNCKKGTIWIDVAV